MTQQHEDVEQIWTPIITIQRQYGPHGLIKTELLVDDMSAATFYPPFFTNETPEEVERLQYIILDHGKPEVNDIAKVLKEEVDNALDN